MILMIDGAGCLSNSSCCFSIPRQSYSPSFPAILPLDCANFFARFCLLNSLSRPLQRANPSQVMSVDGAGCLSNSACCFSIPRQSYSPSFPAILPLDCANFFDPKGDSASIGTSILMSISIYEAQNGVELRLRVHY